MWICYSKILTALFNQPIPQRWVSSAFDADVFYGQRPNPEKLTYTPVGTAMPNVPSKNQIG